MLPEGCYFLYIYRETCKYISFKSPTRIDPGQQGSVLISTVTSVWEGCGFDLHSDISAWVSPQCVPCDDWQPVSVVSFQQSARWIDILVGGFQMLCRCIENLSISEHEGCWVMWPPLWLLMNSALTRTGWKQRLHFISVGLFPRANFSAVGLCLSCAAMATSKLRDLPVDCVFVQLRDFYKMEECVCACEYTFTPEHTLLDLSFPFVSSFCCQFWPSRGLRHW